MAVHRIIPRFQYDTGGKDSIFNIAVWVLLIPVLVIWKTDVLAKIFGVAIILQVERKILYKRVLACVTKERTGLAEKID